MDEVEMSMFLPSLAVKSPLLGIVPQPSRPCRLAAAVVKEVMPQAKAVMVMYR